MTNTFTRRLLATGTLALIAALATVGILAGETPLAATGGAVHARFGLDDPEAGPFPSDVFTVADPAHLTGRRVNLPYPDCAVRVSDCEDLDVINTCNKKTTLRAEQGTVATTKSLASSGDDSTAFAGRDK